MRPVGQLLALLVTGLAATVAAASDLAEQKELAPRLALFELWIRDQMAHLDQPGVAVGIVVEEELVWERGFGYRDVERRLPVTPDSVFRIGSISKLFTATALLHLRDAGRLRLDDAVRAHLPWFDYRNRKAGGHEITLRHLLTHTSGLPREADLPYWTDRRFPSREQLRASLVEQETLFEPYAGYRYSNLGLALAGEVVAAVAEQDYEDYLQRAILEPLGMTRTSVRFEDVERHNLATGYLLRRADGTRPVAPPTHAQALAPAASLSSSLRDLARFVAAHLRRDESEVTRVGGAALLVPSTLREMHRVHWLSPDWKGGRGLGFQIWRQGERTLVGHGGWVAGYRSQLAFDPAARIGVIVLTNSDQGGPGSYTRQAFDLVAPAIERLLHGEPTVTPVVEPERYTGTYHDPWGALTEVLVLDGTLVLYRRSRPPTDDVLGSVSVLRPHGEHSFRRADATPVTFELLDDGRVARVKLGANYLFPDDCGSLGEDLQCRWDE